MINPTAVQEASPTKPGIPQDPFVFIVCQHGVESVIKQHWLKEGGPLKLAFSRPGLITFKVVKTGSGKGRSATAVSPERVADLVWQLSGDWAVRHVGTAICNLVGEDAGKLVEQVWERAGRDWDAVHVFQRDPYLPGVRGFEPGPTELSDAVADTLRASLAASGHKLRVNSTCEPGSRVLDIMLVEPDRWLVGQHVSDRRQACWPGGAITTSGPTEMISRAYLKMAEAITWSQLPIETGDAVVEIGSAPGGSCQRLLDLGLDVIGIDPAEMHPALLEHPRFSHWRNKAAAVRRKQFRRFRWLTSDASASPTYTLDAVEEIVKYPTTVVEGLLLTLKLTSYDLAEHFGDYERRIRSWGFERVEFRQLASNRGEVCVVAQRTRSKAQRGPKATDKK